MGKSRRGHKEYSREQRLIYENKKLKREIASLRKQMARLDLDRHSYVREIIEKAYELEDAQEGAQIVEKLKHQWKCRECHNGHLEICVYSRPDGPWYYRKCTNCSHRTKAQKYSPSVPGILKEVPEPKKSK